MPNWASVVISAFVTILASGTVAGFVSNFVSSRREWRALLRQKAETLYMAAENFQNTWGQQCVMLQGVVRSEITYNQMFDLQVANHDKEDARLNRQMVMLTDIYFPETKKELDPVLAANDEFNKIRDAHKAAYREGHTKVFGWAEHFEPLAHNFDRACEAYKNRIVAVAQTHSNPKLLG